MGKLKSLLLAPPLHSPSTADTLLEAFSACVPLWAPSSAAELLGLRGAPPSEGRSIVSSQPQSSAVPLGPALPGVGLGAGDVDPEGLISWVREGEP